MSQYNYNERVYQDLESLYKENRKDNLVTLDDFKHNYLEKGLSIEQALIFRDLTENEKKKK